MTVRRRSVYNAVVVKGVGCGGTECYPQASASGAQLSLLREPSLLSSLSLQSFSCAVVQLALECPAIVVFSPPCGAADRSSLVAE